MQTLFEDWHIVKTTRLILSDYLRWNLLMDDIELRNHITTLQPDRTSKNLILAQHGCKTWFIYPDNSSADAHTGWNEHILVSPFAFIMADTAVVYNDKIRRLLEYHRNNFREYVVVGMLPAQRVREIRDGVAGSSLKDILTHRNVPRIRIGVFDTTYSTYGVPKINDGIQFGKDMLQLLNDFPDVEIIFKEKKFRNFTPEVIPFYQELEKHPRCITLKRGTGISASDVIAVSDFIISAAYTSTTGEALCTRTKAIYYENAGRNIGDNYYFNRFPLLAAHDYPQLIEYTKHWLYHVSKADFDLYLEKYIKGEFDPYLDGHAVDRLKQLLLEN
jgi:polysaccharide biosynthesis PFTS motif protein